jgi:hypothetical protein
VRRDRISLDLRGLGPALRALAHDRGTTVANAARAILVSELGRVDLVRERPESKTGDTGDALSETVKVTVRLPADDARELRGRARAAGASYGGYVKALIRGAPANHLADRKQSLDRLAASTDQLGIALRDINCLERLLSRSNDVSTQAFTGTLRGLEREVREHLALASSVIKELKPGAVRPGRISRQQRSGVAAP